MSTCIYDCLSPKSFDIYLTVSLGECEIDNDLPRKRKEPSILRQPDMTILTSNKRKEPALPCPPNIAMGRCDIPSPSLTPLLTPQQQLSTSRSNPRYSSPVANKPPHNNHYLPINQPLVSSPGLSQFFGRSEEFENAFHNAINISLTGDIADQAHEICK